MYTLDLCSTYAGSGQQDGAVGKGCRASKALPEADAAN